jgi:dUTP pyrophosphatase
MIPFNYEVVAANYACDAEQTKSYYSNWTEQGANLLDLYCCGFSIDKMEDYEEYISSYHCVADYSSKFVEIDRQEFCILKPQGRVLVKTGIKIELPVIQDVGMVRRGIVPVGLPQEYIDKYTQAQIYSRSGLALKHGVIVLNAPGIIDQHYTQEIGVILYNAGTEPYQINIGDRIAQMKICVVEVAKPTLVEKIKETERGGFGSSGK